MSKKVIIFALFNGVGIDRDAFLIKNLLQSQGFQVTTADVFKNENHEPHDVSIFLERFSDKKLDISPANILIPNPEWFEPGWVPALRCFVSIFTKTNHSDQVFKKLGCNTDFISFTSLDRYDASIKKDWNRYLHIAGKSIQKQTDVVWETWEKNPGFPNLTIVQNPKFYKKRPLLRNVSYIYDSLPDSVLKTMQNAYGYHVCPSLTEGFGHYIMEALSCKSFVLTTDAEPMSDLVTKERGMLISSYKQERMRFSIAYHINSKALEESVIKTFVINDSDRNLACEKARDFFNENENIFSSAFINSINKYI
jgi:hypothetical protein